jgi:hypothetical protein
MPNRKRIVRFTATRSYGTKRSGNKLIQDFKEADFKTRQDFLKELKSFRKGGVSVKLRYGRKPYVPYKDR